MPRFCRSSPEGASVEVSGVRALYGATHAAWCVVQLRPGRRLSVFDWNPGWSLR
jgi:hypothetical protein